MFSLQTQNQDTDMNDNALRLERVEISDDNQRIDLTVRLEEETHNIFFATKNAPLHFDLDALLALTLPICMIKGADWVPVGQLNQAIWDNLPRIMDFFQAWKPRIYRPKLPYVTPVIRPENPNKNVGLFFTGGVDSFFTLYKYIDQVTDLVYIHGLEMSLEKSILRQEISQMLERVGRELGKNVIEVETNLRKFSSTYASRRVTHGYELAGIAYLLQNHFSSVWIADGVTYDQMRPSSLHPGVTPLLQSQVMKILFDGHDLTRLEKTAILARRAENLSKKPGDYIHVTQEQSQLAMETLRICNENRGGAYNCGTCPKCLRTMLDLRLVNALDLCTTFKEPLDLKRIRQMDLSNTSNASFIKQSLHELERSNRDPELMAALRAALADDGLVKIVRRWVSRLKWRGTPRKKWY